MLLFLYKEKKRGHIGTALNESRFHTQFGKGFIELRFKLMQMPLKYVSRATVEAGCLALGALGFAGQGIPAGRGTVL
ncbi:MAG TPA: hypothetical protein VL525_15380 [Mucilaginibacter sp.]|nr:hypothetical protein [Mucilaginibacter sp.]